MFIQETQKVIDAFLNRFVMHVDIEGPNDDFRMITSVESKEDTIRVFFLIKDYTFCAWFDDKDELHIEVNEESVFNYAEENGWDEEFVNYVKYGKEIKYDKK